MPGRRSSVVTASHSDQSVSRSDSGVEVLRALKVAADTMISDPKGRGRRMHLGVDLAGASGTPIFATADGVVVSAKRESGYGNAVRVRHDFGFETVYAHLSKIRVAAGQKLSRGDRIGDMGSTGRSTGVHLHYEVHLNGRPVNPMPYLETARNVY